MIPTFIVFLGKPGSGKGFLGDYLIGQGLNAKKIVPGEGYRTWVKKRLPRWEYIHDCMKERRFVDDETTISCAEKQIKEKLKEVDLLFFDGFPRNKIQLVAFMSIAESLGAKVYFIHLNRTDAFCKNKAKERTEKDIAANREPRPDSHEGAVQKGLDQFYKHTLPVIQEIQKRGYPIHLLKTDDDLMTVIPSKMNFWALFQLHQFKKTVVDPIGIDDSTCCDAPSHE